MRVLLAGLLCLVIVPPVHANEPLAGYASMKLLFCASGSGNIVGPGLDSEFAVAVVEVNNSRLLPNAPLPEVTLLYEGGKTIGTKRVVSVDVFDEPFVPGESDFAFYLNTDQRGHTHRWDGTLPLGMVHLRVRVALQTQSLESMPKSCRVRIGPSMIEGPAEGIWAT